MSSTGSRPCGSRSKVQLRSSWVGPHTPIEMTSSSPSSWRTMIERLAHGQAHAATRRYRPGSTGQVGTSNGFSEESWDRPSSIVIRSGR